MGRCVILLLVLLATLVPRAGLAETRVRIVESWPAAQEVRLGPRQSFYLRLAYESDRPVRKLPRQAGISKVELPATRWRYSAGIVSFPVKQAFQK